MSSYFFDYRETNTLISSWIREFSK
jgi:hypothetical protein